MLARAALTSLVLLSGTNVLLAQTDEQAKKGEAAYQSVCASCHGTDLRSTEPEAPDLTEGAFKFGWQGKTIAEKFETIRNTMPPGRKGNVDDQTYLDIVAYILRFNKVPEGNQALQPDLEKLKQIVIAVP